MVTPAIIATWERDIKVTIQMWLLLKGIFYYSKTSYRLFDNPEK